MIPIDFLSEFPDKDQFWKLFDWYMLGAYEGDRLVGFGRLVSDGVMHAMIYELIVLPDYQWRGVAGEILERLVKRCQDAGIRDIQLFCAQGKKKFYEKRGFAARPDDAPDMQYVHQRG